MKRIIFESAPEYIILCLLLGLAYAAIQYYKNKQQPWSHTFNWLLFSLRTLVVSFLAFLLLGPIVKQINNIFEKPLFIVLQDNSVSVKEASDSTTLNLVEQKILETRDLLNSKGYETSIEDLSNRTVERDFQYEASSSDLNSAIRRISNRHEGRNIAGVILISDGIYNAGLSPVYTAHNFPIHTVGVGDTTQRSDLAIKNIAYNKIAYEGNKFPLRAEVQVKNIKTPSVTASLYKRGALIEKQTKNISESQLVAFDFQPQADEQGIQKYDIQVELHPQEYNKKNNRSSVFVEVVEGKKKILLVATAPHPDIKALREVVEKNSNYEIRVHIPGVSEQQPAELRPEEIDLAIFHQSPDVRGKTHLLFQSFAASKTSMFLIFGQQSDLMQASRQNAPVKFDVSPRDYDEVTPVINPAFTNFNLSTDAHSIIAHYPPVSVHFGKMQIPLTATSLLFQRVGSVSTEKPLLLIDVKESRKVAVMLGEGFWRWRLNEYDRNENTAAFDELFSKLIQFLSTTDDKRKFRSYPIQQEFSDTEPVIFESQVYNDIFEPVFGNNIEIEITDENGVKREYSYITSPGNTRYQIGGLKEGVYRYRARTSLNNKIEEARGQFGVIERQAELQNLTADFDLLRKLSATTGGQFYGASEIEELKNNLQRKEAKTIIHTEETYDALINLRWVFWILLLFLSAEWALRKFHGSY